MAVVRFEPFRELAALQNEMSRLIHQGFGGQTGSLGGENTWLPALDVWETEGEIVVSVDLPGVDEDQVTIEVEDSMLTISGQRERENDVQEDRYYRFERRVGSFSRSITLPQGVSDVDINADFKDGVLDIHIPKPEERKPKRIAIGSKGAIEGESQRK
jgi:HSP20 family protein